ncbi:hypothetical protein PVAG01_06974 [Phlyctema vagabunda]|uniref:C3H1-type domain-containing protein n=1 Tax=Phlyctema vagabunda TaxID=108571 RepID=A0ABR4PB43_9HELO
MDSNLDQSVDHWQSVLQDICTYFPQAKARLGTLYPDEDEILYPERDRRPQPSSSKKRKTANILAAPALVKLDSCKFCNADFDIEANKIGDSCQWHSGQKEVYEEGLFWHNKHVDDPYALMHNPCTISKHRGVRTDVSAIQDGEVDPKPVTTPSKTDKHRDIIEFPSTPKRKGLFTALKDRRGSMTGSSTTPKRDVSETTPSSTQQHGTSSTRGTTCQRQDNPPITPSKLKDVPASTPEPSTSARPIFETPKKTFNEAHGSKSKEEPAGSTCQFCYEDFDSTKTNAGTCKYYHPGNKEVDYEDLDDFWIDYSERVYGEMVDQVNNPKYAKGFLWDCCGKRGDAEACEAGVHTELTVPLPPSVKRRLSTSLGNVFDWSPSSRKSTAKRRVSGFSREDAITID